MTAAVSRGSAGATTVDSRALTFKPGIHLSVVAGKGVVVLSEGTPALLRGAAHEALASLIDGARSAEDLAAELADRIPPDDVHAALAELRSHGVLETPHPRSARSVAVRAVGAEPTDGLRDLLVSAGIEIADDGDLTVVVTDHYLRPELADLNEEALETGHPWMLVKPAGSEVWIGPLFRPESTGCWECLAQRLRLNRPVDAYLQELRGTHEPIVVGVSTEAARQVAWSLAATAVARWAAGDGHPDVDGRILTVDTTSGQSQNHTLVWRPQCPACGEPDASRDRPAEPVVLQSRPKAFVADGGHRVTAPESTLERFGHHVSPITGAVPRLVRHPNPASAVLHVYWAGLDGATTRVMESLRPVIGASSMGKGATDPQGKASALCEAIERYSGMHRGDEPRRRARMTDLGDAAIHPNDVMRFSDKQIDDYAANPETRVGHPAPARFDETAEIDWTPVWSLTRDAARYLPTSFCYYQSYAPGVPRYAVGCSNGNAAGNTLEEAILQGFFELTERDSVALWWYNRLPRPAVDLESFGEPYLEELNRLLNEQSRDLWVLDLTSDLQIPTFAAISPSAAGEQPDVYRGFGSHFDARIALLRAVTEMNQKLAMVLGDPHPQESSRSSRGWPILTLADEPQMIADPARAPLKAADYSFPWSNDLEEDVLACQALVERHGMEMLVLDQTRPDIGLPVVKVIVPGLRHFWPRLGPGRLYDVPVTEGWLTEPIPEEKLNPISIA